MGHRTLWVLLVALGPGCGSEAGETTGETTGSATAQEPTTSEAGVCPGEPATSTGGTATGADGLCPDHGEVDACCCFRDDWAAPVVCGQRFICQEIVLPGGLESTELEDCAPAVDCALAALAAGDAGAIRWRVPNYYDGQDTVQVHLVGDGTAYRFPTVDGDGGSSVGPAEHYTLHEASLFASCAASTKLNDRVACLLRVLEGDALEMCTMGLGYEAF